MKFEVVLSATYIIYADNEDAAVHEAQQILIDEFGEYSMEKLFSHTVKDLSFTL